MIARVRSPRVVGALAVAALATVALVPVAPSASAAPSVTTIELIQSAPVIVHDEASSATSASGDLTFFESTLRRAGKPFGTLSGMITTHDIIDAGMTRETRLRTLVFELPKGQIIATGASTYPTGPDFVPLDLGKSVTIAITGGTGAYLGASGELRTTRNANGSYRQVIRIVRH